MPATHAMDTELLDPVLVDAILENGLLEAPLERERAPEDDEQDDEVPNVAAFMQKFVEVSLVASGASVIVLLVFYFKLKVL